MGSKYPVLKVTIVISTLKKFGFEFKSQKGSHAKYVKVSRKVIIPMHEEISKGTLKSILEQADIELSDFLDIMKK